MDGGQKKEIFKLYDEMDQLNRQLEQITQPLRNNIVEQTKTSEAIGRDYPIMIDQQRNPKKYSPPPAPTTDTPRHRCKYNFQKLRNLSRNFLQLEQNSKQQTQPLVQRLNRIQTNAHLLLQERWRKLNEQRQ